MIDTTFGQDYVIFLIELNARGRYIKWSQDKSGYNDRKQAAFIEKTNKQNQNKQI